MSVIVVGGGVAGLGAARLLAGRGLEVTLLEAGHQLGGMGSVFQGPDGIWIDKYPSLIGPEDREFLSLMDELGLGDHVRMGRAASGLVVDGRCYDLSRPGDLLRVPLLSAAQKIRLGLSLRRLRGCFNGGTEKLDAIPARKWLEREHGREITEKLWRPLLEARFGQAWSTVPALWVKALLLSERQQRRGPKGTVLGSMRSVLTAAHEELGRLDAKVEMGFAVTQVRLENDGVRVIGSQGSLRARRVLLAVPPTRARRILGAGGILCKTGANSHDPRGMVCGVFLMDRPLLPCLRNHVVSGDLPFDDLIQMSHLRPPEDVGGHHLLYATRFVHRSSDEYQRKEAQVIESFRHGLCRLFPDLKHGGVRYQWAFQAPEVVPVYETGHMLERPPVEAVPGRVYIVNDAQIYPQPISWETRLDQARRAVEWILARRRLETRERRQSFDATDDGVLKT